MTACEINDSLYPSKMLLCSTGAAPYMYRVTMSIISHKSDHVQLANSSHEEHVACPSEQCTNDFSVHNAAGELRLGQDIKRLTKPKNIEQLHKIWNKSSNTY